MTRKIVITLCFLWVVTMPGLVFAADYLPVTTIPGVTTAGQAVEFSTYLNRVYTFGIALSFALAVVMLTIAGFQYVGSEAFTSKEAAKKRIWGAIQGLLLVISSYLILNTINPDLVNFKLDTTLPPAANDTTVPPPPVNCKPSQPQPGNRGIYFKHSIPQPGCPVTLYHTFESMGAISVENLAQCEARKQSTTVGQGTCLTIYDVFCSEVDDARTTPLVGNSYLDDFVTWLVVGDQGSKHFKLCYGGQEHLEEGDDSFCGEKTFLFVGRCNLFNNPNNLRLCTVAKDCYKEGSGQTES